MMVSMGRTSLELAPLEVAGGIVRPTSNGVKSEEAHQRLNGYILLITNSSWFDLCHKSPLIGSMAFASFEHELADPGAGIEGQRSVP